MEPVVLTGMGQSDLAAATADALASGDAAALILLGRSQTEIQPVFEAINNKYPKVKVIFITMDVCKLSSVRGATEVIRKLEVPIDGIIGFPMVMAGEWAMTKDGIESHFQINYLTHFVLVNRLLEMIPEEGRVVMVSSSIRPDAMAFRFDDTNFAVSSSAVWVYVLIEWANVGLLQNGKTYHPLDGYAQSMFACVQFTKGLAASGSTRPVLAFSVNPGSECL